MLIAHARPRYSSILSIKMRSPITNSGLIAAMLPLLQALALTVFLSGATARHIPGDLETRVERRATSSYQYYNKKTSRKNWSSYGLSLGT